VAVLGPQGFLVLTNGFGDFNTDGRVDVLDLVRLNNHLNGTRPLPANLTARADLNQDGQVSRADAVILAGLILRRDAKTDEDFDSDELSNTEELRLGTNLFDPDTDHDGSLDGWEVIEATNPLDPQSRIPMTIVASPPVQVIHPLIQDTDTNAPGPVVASPPVQIIHPLIKDTDTNAPGPVVARPPVQVLFPAFAEEEEKGAIVVARPPVQIIHPLIQDTDTNAPGPVLARPPVQVTNPNQ
jgi:hypothetical protein